MKNTTKRKVKPSQAGSRKQTTVNTLIAQVEQEALTALKELQEAENRKLSGFSALEKLELLRMDEREFFEGFDCVEVWDTNSMLTTLEIAFCREPGKRIQDVENASITYNRVKKLLVHLSYYRNLITSMQLVATARVEKVETAIETERKQQQKKAA